MGIRLLNLAIGDDMTVEDVIKEFDGQIGQLKITDNLGDYIYSTKDEIDSIDKSILDRYVIGCRARRRDYGYFVCIELDNTELED